MININFKSLDNKNLINFYSIVIFILTSYFLFLNFFNESGYWYDEWCTLLSSDPNVELSTIYERHNGNFEKPYENVPIIYYLVLRFFFSVFGYTSENGRIFSLIFLLFSSLTFYYFLQSFIKKKESLFATSIFFSTPLILWMSNETRVDMFVVFFVILNISIFFLVLKHDRIENKILLLIINIVTLSIYPLTLSIIGSQLLFLIFQKFLEKSKNHLSILVVLFSIIFYFVLNYDYFLERSLNRDYHFTKLHLNFFILYFFNIFFGSVFFGIIFFLISIFFLIKQNKKIIKDQLILFCVISIFLTYLMVILSSLLVTPIAAPRYIIFIIPIILIFIIKSSIDLKNKNFFLFSLFIITLINVTINYDKRHVKKPHTVQALNLIEKYSEKNILVLPQTILYQNYVSTVSKIKTFRLFFNFDEIKNEQIQTFTVLCLYKPRFVGDEKNHKRYEYCNENYAGFENFEELLIPDYKIRFFKTIR